ncbi:hypothetical protein BSU04_14670 [Caballeronia sordidicola]|uniref:Uncharacterized protein n=1 Tax=Caballeronia sordidicola TaxID=196367 RepID=A0A226X4F8_CABSO|nr:hypothetical protein BSU04_14670 [Caballeronia sordidicola]
MKMIAVAGGARSVSIHHMDCLTGTFRQAFLRENRNGLST